MNRFEPFVSAEELAENSFCSLEAIERLSNSEFEYNQYMLNDIINNAIKHKAYRDTPDAVRAELIVSDSIDISHTWRKASKCERGGNSQVSYRSVANHKRAKVI